MTLAYSNAIHEILQIASDKIHELKDRIIDVVDVIKPPDFEYAGHLSLVLSKLSPLIGNMIGFAIVSELNRSDWSRYKGKWDRQDPGFPDTIFQWDKEVKPGIEVKTWFPFATEITARFKDSQLHFANNQTHVAIVAWTPEYLIYGKPRIMDIFIDTAKSFDGMRCADLGQIRVAGETVFGLVGKCWNQFHWLGLARIEPPGEENRDEEEKGKQRIKDEG